MSLATFKAQLLALLHERQQNAVAYILRQISASAYRYDKVAFQSIQSSMSPLGLSLMAAQIVQSTEILIGSLAEKATVELPEYERILNKIRQNRGIGTTDVLQDKSVADLDERELLRLFQQERTIFELDNAEADWQEKTVHQRLVALALAENGHLLKGTFLCIGKRNQIANLCSTASEAKFTQFKGINRNIILSMEDVKGGMIQQYERMIQLLRSHVPLGRDRLRNTDEYEIPMIAMRELVANAFVHRDYGQDVKAFVQVELYDDRLEIKNPGRLPEGLNLANIEGTLLVNPVVMAIFHLYKYVEKRGSGITVAQTVLRENGLELAKIEQIEQPEIVKVTIFRKQIEQIPTFNADTQTLIRTRLSEGNIAGVFAILDELGLRSDRYSRLKHDLANDDSGIDYINRLQQYLNTILPPPTPQNTSSLAQTAQASVLKNLIAQAKTKQALADFSAIIGSEHELANDLFLLQSRYNRNENSHLKGLITDEVHRLENNKIGAALLYYIDDFFR